MTRKNGKVTLRWDREHHSKDGRFYISAECIGRVSAQQYRLYDRQTGKSHVAYTVRDAKHKAELIANPPAPPPPPTREQLVAALPVAESNFLMAVRDVRRALAKGDLAEARSRAKWGRKQWTKLIELRARAA